MKYLLFIFFLCCVASPRVMAQIQNFGSAEDSLLTLQRDVLQADYLVESPASSQLEIVSASRSARPINELPLTVHVVTRQQILDNGYVSLADLMKMVPGVRVSQPGSAEEGDTFLMRGLMGNYYMKILLNGIPLQPSASGGLALGAQLPVRQAERVEIIYGPASAVYGADATSGVINIITKTSEKGVWAQADAEVGSQGYDYLNFMVGGKLGKNENVVQYSFYGSRYNIEDMNLDGHPGILFNPLSYFMINSETWDVKDSGGKPVAPQDFSEATLLKLGIDPQTFIASQYEPNYRGSLTRAQTSNTPRSARMVGVEFRYKGLKVGYQTMQRLDFSSFGRSPWIYSHAYPQAFYGEDISRLSLSYYRQWSPKVSTTTNLSYLWHRMNNGTALAVNYQNGGNGLAYLYEASDDIFAEQLLTWHPVQNLEVLAGASFQYSGNLPRTNELLQPFDVNKYSPFSTSLPVPNPYWGHFGYNPLTFSNLAGFVQLYWNWRRFNIIAGTRADHNSLFGTTINPRVAAMYRFSDKVSARASVGTSFKAAGASTMYNSLAILAHPDSNLVLYPIVPNPDLEPEKVRSYELGGRVQFNKNIFLDVSVYHNQIDNLIKGVLVELEDGKFLNAVELGYRSRSTVNSDVAKSELYGVQTTLSARELFGELKLGADLNITLTRGHETLDTSAETINSFLSVPGFTGQLRLFFYPTKNLYINLENTLLSSWYRRYTPDVASFEQNDIFRTDGYYNLDVMARWQLNEYLSTFLRVRNLFNAMYGGIDATGLDIDMLYNPQPGRMIQGGLTFRFE